MARPEEKYIDKMLGKDHTFTADGVSGPCMFTVHDELENELGPLPQQYAVICALVNATTFAALEQDDEVEVDGEPYIVYRKLRVQDGAVLEVWLHESA